MASAGVRGDRLANMYKLYVDGIEFPDDGRPIVRETADPDVKMAGRI